VSGVARITLLLTALLLGGCAGLRGYRDHPQLADRPDCALLLGAMQTRVAAAGVVDPFAEPLADYPYLRSTRLLASYRAELQAPARFDFWLSELLALGRQARGYALDNLPPEQGFSAAQRRQIDTCIQTLAARDAAQADFRPRLLRQAEVDDAYADGLRLLGLFPLTRQVVLYQVRRVQRRWRAEFNASPGLQGASRIYRPAAPADAPPALAEALRRARAAHPLGWPRPDDATLARLFDYHAPEWQLFYRSAADRIGAPRWRRQQPWIDTEDPVSYHLLSYTRFGGQTLLQLNYLVWLPERPPQGALDIYAGPIDGLIWRVTLAADGSVLLYDSIHACGCYHLLFPVDPRLQPRALSSQTEAPLLLPGVAPARTAGRIRLQLTPTAHYLMGITSAAPDTAGATPYRWESYHRLRSLPGDRGRRGLFDPDGLIGASARPERWLLWPMGVPSAGAQRIWGRHAISFASKRHFDDPYMLEELLRWSDAGASAR